MDPSPPASPAICDVNQGAGINAANHVLVGLTIIVVAVRFAVRFWIVKDIRWDDWTILLALVSKTLYRVLRIMEREANVYYTEY